MEWLVAVETGMARVASSARVEATAERVAATQVAAASAREAVGMELEAAVRALVAEAMAGEGEEKGTGHRAAAMRGVEVAGTGVVVVQLARVVVVKDPVRRAWAKETAIRVVVEGTVEKVAVAATRGATVEVRVEERWSKSGRSLYHADAAG